MRYLVDGYNFLFWQPGPGILPASQGWQPEGRDLRYARSQLIDYLSELALHSHLHFALVFDSPKTPGDATYERYCPFEVIYSPQGMSADAWMIEASCASRKGQLCIVTQDKRLKRQLHGYDVEVIGFELFLERLRKKQPSHRIEKTTSSSEIDKRLCQKYTQIFEQRYRMLFPDDK